MPSSCRMRERWSRDSLETARVDAVRHQDGLADGGLRLEELLGRPSQHATSTSQLAAARSSIPRMSRRSHGGPPRLRAAREVVLRRCAC